LASPKDALLFVRAVGNGNKWGHDVRAVVVNRLSEGQWNVDVVMTGKVPVPLAFECMQPVFLPQSARDLAEIVVNDPEVSARFPGAKLGSYELLELEGPQSAVEFWLAHHLLWDAGKPTLKFGKADGVYWGQADDAPNVKPWSLGQPPLGPFDKGSTPGNSTAAAVILVCGVVAAALWLAGSKKKGA
jgi:hypothetical protein